MIMDYTDSIKKIYSNISSCDFDREVDVRFDNKYSLFSSAANLFKNTVNNPWESAIKKYSQEIDKAEIGLFKELQCSSSENHQNDIKLYSFNERTPFFISLLKDTDFEDGYENPAVVFFKNMLSENYAIAFIWINNLYISNIDNQKKKKKILRILCFLKYDETIMASFPIIAANAIITGSDNVKEAAIMAFEAWRTPTCLGLLKKLKVEKEWLRVYLHQVINELEQETSLC